MEQGTTITEKDIQRIFQNLPKRNVKEWVTISFLPPKLPLFDDENKQENLKDEADGMEKIIQHQRKFNMTFEEAAIDLARKKIREDLKMMEDQFWGIYETRSQKAKRLAVQYFLQKRKGSRYSTAGNHQASLRYLKKLQKESKRQFASAAEK